MMRIGSFVLLAALVFICAVNASADNERSQQSKHKIGVLVPLSGDFVSFGDLVRKGIEQVQHEGVEFVFEDSACTAQRAIRAYQKLANVDGIKFFLGPCCGSPQKTVAPLIRSAEKLMLLPNSATEDLYQISGGKVFSAQYSIESESLFNARLMNKRGIKKVVIAYFENEFSRDHEKGFRQGFDGEVVAVQRFPDMSQEHSKTFALKLKRLDYDGIYFPDVTPLLMGVLTEMAKIRVPKKPVFGVYSTQMQDVLNIEGRNAEGIFYSYPAIQDLNAISYFPRRAAEELAQAVAACSGDVPCVSKRLREEQGFDKHGVLTSELELRTVQNGKFVKYTG